MCPDGLGHIFFLSNCLHILRYGSKVVFLRAESAVATGRECRWYRVKVPLVRGVSDVCAGRETACCEFLAAAENISSARR